MGLRRASSENFEAVLLLLNTQQLLRCPAVIHSLHISFCEIILQQRTTACWLSLLFFFLLHSISSRICWQMMRWHTQAVMVFVFRAISQENIFVWKFAKYGFTFHNFRIILFSYFNICICFPFDAFRNVIHCLGCLYMCNVFYHEPDFLPCSLHIQLFLIL